MFLDQLKHLFPSRDGRIAAIVHGSAVEGGAVGLATAQVPGDRFIIGAVQINMIITIASEYGVSLDKSAALALLSSTIASMIGVEVANGIIKYIPGVGNISNMATAASITETIGWATKQYYEGRNK
jgi:uncharacterized protein (DUF697 family)